MVYPKIFNPWINARTVRLEGHSSLQGRGREEPNLQRGPTRGLQWPGQSRLTARVDEPLPKGVQNRVAAVTTAESVSTNFFRNVYCILGLPFDAITLPQAVEAIRRAAQRRERCFLSTPNLNFLIGCRHDAAFRDSVLRSTLSVADGMLIVWLGRLLGSPVPERVAGSSIFERLFALPSDVSVYFFGGPDGAAEEAAGVVNSQASKMRCVGFRSPGYGSVEELSTNEIIAHINACKPDLLVVATGAKKGQDWIIRNREAINAPAISHLGAVVNLVAGRIARAPEWAQKTGLEWLWRITQEPHLWRRYAGDGMRLIALLVTHVVPALFHLRMKKMPRVLFDRAKIELEINDSHARIKLSGAWGAANAGPLRLACSRATDRYRDVVVDLNQACFIDSACVGLLVLLYGHQGQGRRGWRLEYSGTTLRQIIQAHGAEYLLIERIVAE
ncbi:MAG: N-acetylglucosaminyldiphospho-UDP N-acetyl-beta-D-mannosaminyltransferase [Herminiimonas sp.]|nr:N-acetylglucosaminyldiphospho-UDP N-acetyl-beta-D-mannosaminyltransferase [Herminiimonas sp.]